MNQSHDFISGAAFIVDWMKINDAIPGDTNTREIVTSAINEAERLCMIEPATQKEATKK